MIETTVCMWLKPEENHASGDDNLLQSSPIWDTLKSSTESGNSDCYNAYRLKKSSMDPVKRIYFLAYILILLSLPCLYKTEECLQCNTKDHLLKARLKSFQYPRNLQKPGVFRSCFLALPLPTDIPGTKIHCFLVCRINFTLWWTFLILQD